MSFALRIILPAGGQGLLGARSEAPIQKRFVQLPTAGVNKTLET